MTDLLDAYDLASQHKYWRDSRLRFDYSLERELVELANQIYTRTYQPRPSHIFIVDVPKPREVVAANFRDRLVHHYVCHFIAPYLERILIYDCYSCRVGKGTHKGIERLRHHILSASDNYSKPCYILQCDISAYFMSLSRDKLLEKTHHFLDWIGRQRVDSKEYRYEQTKYFDTIRYLVECVVLHNPLEEAILACHPAKWKLLPASKSLYYSPDNCGLPIGNLTSQLFSNLYLNDFDQYVKRTLGVKHYGRYVDDFYLLSPSVEQLNTWLKSISARLAVDALKLHEHKTKILDVHRGVLFLGAYILPYRTYVSSHTLQRISSGVQAMSAPRNDEEWEQRYRSTNSYLGVLGHYKSYKLRTELFSRGFMSHYAYPTAWLTKYIRRESLRASSWQSRDFDGQPAHV